MSDGSSAFVNKAFSFKINDVLHGVVELEAAGQVLRDAHAKPGERNEAFYQGLLRNYRQTGVKVVRSIEALRDAVHMAQEGRVDINVTPQLFNQCVDLERRFDEEVEKMYTVFPEMEQQFEAGRAKQVAKAKAGKDGGCYLATAVYGSYDAPSVLVLRRFRDERLAPHRFGRVLIRAYYRLSPPLANRFAPNSAPTRLARRALDIVVSKLDR